MNRFAIVCALGIASGAGTVISIYGGLLGLSLLFAFSGIWVASVYELEQWDQRRTEALYDK